MPDNIVVFMVDLIKTAIALNGGPVYDRDTVKDDWTQTSSKTTKESAGTTETWKLEYKSPKGDTISTTYWLSRHSIFKDASTGRRFEGAGSGIEFRFHLKLLPEIVRFIGEKVEEELKNYLTEQGGTFIKYKWET
jgi:hypothetical protein